MFGLDQILASARAEVRTARRLARTWMFAVVALLFALLGYGQQVFFHTIGSGISVTVGGMMVPRFVVAQLGAQMLWVLMAALIFLAFDIRARDQRERMHEVLDTRAIDNFAALLGRLLGLVLVGWLPLAILALITLGLTGIAAAADWWINPAIEPRSMIVLLLIDAPVNLAVWGALVMLLAVTVRNRLAVAVIALALLGLYIYAFFQSPIYLTGTFAPIGDAVALPSDLAPVFLSWSSVGQRVCYLAVAVGLLALAAVVHPRPDSVPRRGPADRRCRVDGAWRRGRRQYRHQRDLRNKEREVWAAVHAKAKDAPRADLRSLGGSVAIDPGDRLALDIEATYTTPAAMPEALVFTLNPGLAISALRIDGQDVDFTFDAGLLTIQRPPTPGPEGSSTLSVEAAGRPDQRFAYLDAAYDPSTMRAVEAGVLLLLGTVAGIFHDDYVALMPGTGWLPMPGAHVGGHDPDRGRDFLLDGPRSRGAARLARCGTWQAAARWRSRRQRPIPVQSGRTRGELRLVRGTVRAARHRSRRRGAGTARESEARGQPAVLRGRGGRVAGAHQ